MMIGSPTTPTTTTNNNNKPPQQQRPRRTRTAIRAGLLIGVVVSLTSLAFYPSTSQQLSLLGAASWQQEPLLPNITTTTIIVGGNGDGGVGGEPAAGMLTTTNSSSGSTQTSEATSARSAEEKQEENKKQEKKTSQHNEPVVVVEKQQQRQHPPLNIIILYPDDMRHDSLSSVGKWPVFTPRLDDLAQRGIRFARNCVTTSICWVSRATLFTGQYLARHQAPKLYKTGWYDKWNETWPALLQRHGDYYVGHIGKWQYHKMEFVSTVFNWTRLFEGEHYYNVPGRGRVHATDHARDSTIEFLRDIRPHDKNFAVTVAFYPPKALSHEPLFNPQPESAYLYENVTIPLPVEDPMVGWDHLNRKVFGDRNYGKKVYNEIFGSFSAAAAANGTFTAGEPGPLYQENMKKMYRMIHEVDAACGAIIDELDRQGILNSTMIIFTADNGYLQGEHGLGGKWFPFEESIRVPLIIYDPRMPMSQRGKVRDELTLNVDLAETILGAAGLTPTAGMQGRDIADLYLDNAKDWRDEFYYEHPMHLAENAIPQSSAIVRKNIKYMTWDNLHVESLYDLAKDPNELHNVINDPAYATVLSELKQRYQELKQKVEEPYNPS
jgi:arylsulfatase